MLFDYSCKSCGEVLEKDFPIGEAPSSIECECGERAKRSFGCSFILKGGGWPSKFHRFNKEMTERNEAAGRRMRKEHGDGPLKQVAWDHGNGDIREIE